MTLLASSFGQRIQDFALTWLPVMFFLLMCVVVWLLWRTVKLMPRVKPLEITPEHVTIEAARKEKLPNDFVFVCIGGELPTAWLGKIGVEVKTLRGEAHPAMGRS